MVRELNQEDEFILEQLMKKTESEKMIFLLPFLEKYYDKSLIKITKDYMAVMYDGPICLVAHLDCVQEDKKGYQFIYDRKRGTASSIFGLGYDDAAGIALILKLLNAGYRFPILFPCGEEIGMVGACKFVADYPASPWPNLKFFMELDRKGSCDLVTYDYQNPVFDTYIQSFGYFVKAYGTCSDISVLSPSYKMAACNLSVGYEYEHTANEFLDITNWLKVYDAICDILDDRDNCPKFEYHEASLSNYSFGFDDNDYYNISQGLYCDGCGIDKQHAELDWGYDETGQVICLCENCIKNYCLICDDCQAPYIPLLNDVVCICENCRKSRHKRIRY